MKSIFSHSRPLLGNALEPRECRRALASAFVGSALLSALLLSNVSVARAQVYGVARRTTVVSGPNRTVAVRQTAVVTGGGALPRGYIATLPVGYRPVYVGGVRYYSVGGVYYRPQIYGGRTTYVVVHL
jgi:hypothetical protein